MRREQTGRYEITTVGGEQIRAFIPARLPPAPPVAIDASLSSALEQATLAVGRLDGVSAVLPDVDLLLYTSGDRS